MSREIKFRAKFRHVLNGEEVWQYIGVNQQLTMPSYVQVTEWERIAGTVAGYDLYSGDLLKWEETSVIFEVVFCNDTWSFIAKSKHREPILLHRVINECTLIGNIHENKDLLK